MQRVDLVIAGVGAVALIATVAGVVFYDEVTAEPEINYELATNEMALDVEPTRVGDGASQDFTFPMPANATGADFEITVTFQGRAAFGDSDIQVSAELRDPTEAQTIYTFDPQSLNVPQNQGAGSPSVTLSLPAPLFWAETPENGTEVDPLVWPNDLVLTVSIQATGDDGAGVGLPGQAPVTFYAYDIEVDGTLYEFFRPVQRTDVTVN